MMQADAFGDFEQSHQPSWVRAVGRRGGNGRTGRDRFSMRSLCGADLQARCRFCVVSQVLCADFVQGPGDMAYRDLVDHLRRDRASEP